MGRWSSTTYALHNKASLTVISAYQVCQDNQSTTGLTSAYTQQLSMLRLQNDFTKPRNRFISDLKALMLSLIDKSHMIILAGDFNEYLSSDHSNLKKVLNDCQLVDILPHQHGASVDIPTYVGGRFRIHYIFTS